MAVIWQQGPLRSKLILLIDLNLNDCNDLQLREDVASIFRIGRFIFYDDIIFIVMKIHIVSKFLAMYQYNKLSLLNI